MQIWLMNANGNSSNGKLNGIGNVPNWSVLIWKIELKIKPNLFYVLKQNLIWPFDIGDIGECVWIQSSQNLE